MILSISGCFLLKRKLPSQLFKVVKLTIFLLTVTLLQVQAKDFSRVTSSPEEGPVKNVSATLALQRNIQGVVTDNKGTPLAGVSVVVKASRKGTSTGADGSFTIDANTGDVLEFSMVGYQRRSVVVDQERNLTVVLEIEAEVGNEVVIVGYGTQKKSDLT